MIKAILFDGGGVFIESKQHEATCRLIEEKYNVPFSDLFKIWRKTWLDYEIAAISGEQFWMTLSSYFDIPLDVEEGMDFYRKTLKIIPGTRELAESLKGKYLLVLANNEANEFDVARNAVAGYFDLVDVRCSSFILKKAKPDPAYFTSLLEKIEMQPEECVFIDDKQENIDAAAALGIQTILFKSPNQLAAELKTLGVNT